MNQVEENESFIAALEDEAIEVECLLVEPKDHISVDGVLCFGKDNPERCMGIEGGLDSISTREAEDHLKVRVFDVTPHEVDEVEYSQAASGVPSTCDDYLLDFEYAESVSKMDHVPSEELHLGISHSESQITGFSDCDNSALAISKLSAIIPLPDEQNDLVDKTICELHCFLSSKCGCETPVEDSLWLKCPISYELQSIDKLESVSNILDIGISSSKNEKGMIFAEIGRAVEKESLGARDLLKSSSTKERVADVLPTRKRSRKPPQRYIEESSDLSSRHCRRRQRISTSTPSDKFSGVRRYKHQDIGSKAMTLVTEESIGRLSIPVPFGPPVQREGHRKHVSIVEPKEEPVEVEHATTLQFDKSDSRRKHHRLWTLLEVKKLIDGVSQHGVGKWTVIKKLLFSSSAHRTPVDLKDKWRNLLRTSCLQTPSKRKDEHKQKTAWRPLPKAVLRRVSELAVVYPYPRDRKSKISPVHHLSLSALPTRSTIAPSQRTGRRKNLS